MGNTKTTEKTIQILESLLDGSKEFTIDTITMSDILDRLVESRYVDLDESYVTDKKVYTITESGKNHRDFLLFRDLEEKKEYELLEQRKQNIEKDKENSRLLILSSLKESTGRYVEIKNKEVLESLKTLVTDNLILSEEIGGKKHYTITTEGKDFLKFKDYQQTKDQETELKIQDSWIKVEYKRKHPTVDLIENVSEKFLLEDDGIPVIQVKSENYKKILDRKYNEHWYKYVGESASKLIKNKKLTRFYVENTETKRKYLYIVPTK
jgi:DNA-binding PadR family transcriptional regulator